MTSERSLLLWTMTLLTIVAVGCMDLNDALYNHTRVDHYTLSAAVIPDSARTFVQLDVGGKKVYGFFVRSNGVHASYTVLYCHGNRDNLAYYWDRVELLYRMGFNVFVFDYEGYGMSEGSPSEQALYADGHAALEYILTSAPVVSKEIVFYGFSLGNVVTINLAATEYRPHVLIAEAPFASAQSLMQSGTVLDIPSSYVMKGSYDNAAKIERVGAPVLVIHGVNDTFIDIDKNGQVVYDHANPPKRMVRVVGANHTDIPAVMGESAYIALVRDFCLAPPAP